MVGMIGYHFRKERASFQTTTSEPESCVRIVDKDFDFARTEGSGQLMCLVRRYLG